MKRSTSFGFGNKISFPPMKRNTPSPFQYTIPSQFLSRQNSKRGFSFGLSFEACSKLLVKRKHPGPGQYSEMKVMGNCGAKYSFRRRSPTACKFIKNFRLVFKERYTWSRKLYRHCWNYST